MIEFRPGQPLFLVLIGSLVARCNKEIQISIDMDWYIYGLETVVRVLFSNIHTRLINAHRFDMVYRYGF